MAYLLIIPICLYIVLATIVLQRLPRGLSNIVLAIYLFSAAVNTGALLIMGTTDQRTVAEMAAVSVVLMSTWSYLGFLPLALVCLHFEAWVRQYWRRLLAADLAIVLAADAAVIGSMIASDRPLVHPLEIGYAMGWIFDSMTASWQLNAALMLGSQVPSMLAAGFALAYGRLTLWRGAVPFVLASLLGMLIPPLALITGPQLSALIAGLAHGLPVLLLTRFVFRASSRVPPAALIESVLGGESQGVIVIDAQRRVLWKNAYMARWLVARESGAVASPHLFELLRGSPLERPIRRMIVRGEQTGECEFTEAGEQVVVQIDRRALERVPGAQVLTFRDVTASRIRQDLDERRQELLALSAVSAEIASSLDVDKVIARALQQLPLIARLDRAVVYLVDSQDPDHLYLAGDLALIDALPAPPATLPVMGSKAGEVVRTHQIGHMTSAERPSERLTMLIAHGLMSGVTIPLIVREKVIGALQIVRREPRPYDAIEVALLESVGRQLAVAIDNARLHSEERRQRHVAEALREVASILTSSPLDDALQALLDKLGEVLQHDRSAILLLAEPGQLTVRASVGFESAPNHIPERENIRIEIAQHPHVLQVFTLRAPQLIRDVTQDPDWAPNSYVYGSWIGVPLIIHDQVLGILSIVHKQPNHFTESDMRLATAFAAQAVIAVENAQLFEAEQRRRRQAELLQQVSYDLVINPDLDSALLSALASLDNVLHFDRAHVGLITEDGRSWLPRASYPSSLKIPADQPVFLEDYPLIQRVIERQRAILVADTRQNKWWKPGTFATNEVRCWIGAPLIVRDRLIGVLNIDSFEPHRFTAEQLQIVPLFANQMAAAIENFRLLEEASRQNRALRALNTVLSASNEALPQQNQLVVALDRILETLHLSGGAIHESDPATGTMRLRAASGLPPGVTEHLSRLPLAASLPSVVLPEGEPVAFFSVPLVSHGTEIGLLSICQDDQTAFPAELQQLLANIGQQLGVVMDNAILFEDTLRREVLSTDLGRLSLAISAQLDRETVLDLICRESLAVFNAHGAYIWLLQDQHLVGAGAYGPGADWVRQSRYALDEAGLLPARAIRERRALYVNRAIDSAQVPADLLEHTQARAVIAVPLMKADTSIGTLMLTNTRHADAFADWLIEQIGLFGVQAALAIQNAGLFEELRHRLDHLRLVNEVGRYATAILSPRSLMEGVARKLADTLSYDIVSLIQLEDDNLFIHAVFVRGQNVAIDDVPELRASLQDISQQAIWQAEPVLTNRLSRLTDAGEPVESCSLAVPLIVANEAIGVLFVERQGYHSITTTDLDVLEPLAAQLAISVSNARLFEKVRQQTVELEARVIERTAEIRQQQERTEAILGSVADAVIVFDLHGQVVMTNPVAKDLFARHDLEMNLGARIGSLVARTLDAGAETSDLTEIITLQNVSLQAKAARVVEGDQVLGSVVVLRDISRLQELDRMKDRFVSTVSHELRTPLANLKLYLSLLQHGRPERRDGYMAVMDREVARLERLITDLLDLSRLQGELRAERPQVRESINIEALINTVIHDNSAWAESKQCELRHERLNASLPRITGDPDQVVRALTNLVSNAINYTPEGGQVVVRSQAGRSEQTDQEWVIIEVVDNGIGIPAAELPMIFERFYRGTNVSPNIPGTGLGLAIIKEIVELHGGSIEADSEEGRGSTFRLKLPASTPA
ncbi:MAG: GAF domain-containing protein [Anaerolineae bacterium]|nr:GAF domain-containing protein [Anaerolineae bacterium]